MARQNQGPNMDQFEAFFKRADLDGDGRISGAEAVAFFQGSNLPKQVLAQIWMHADQARTGFLGRTEFFNALKLVTVSQSKRELTPDIVKAALYGPAAAKIPAPQISLPAAPTPQFNSMAATSAPHMGAVTPTSTQNLGLRGPGLLNVNMNQNYFPQQNQSTRPPQPMPAGAISRPPQGITSTEISRGGSAVGSGVPNSSISNDWLGGRTGGATPGPRGVSPSMPSAASKPPSVVSMSSQPTVNVSKALGVSGNGFTSDSVFGGDIFSAAPSSSKQEPSSPIYSASSASASSAIVPVSSGPQPSVKPNSFDSLQSAFSMQPAGNQLPRTQPPLTPSQPTQQVPAQGFSSFEPSGISAGSGNSASNNTQIPWPKMKPSDVQKYTKVFMEVDADRDGKITGEEARNLFLSWRLPREVLKQVWDLSDQDNDSMLSLREFCFALYLMERFREGRPLPAALPSNIMFDETLLSMTGQPNVTYGNAAWGASHGFGQQQGMGARPVAPATGLRPPMQVTAPLVGRSMPSNQQKSRVPVLDGSFLDQHDNGEHISNSKLQEATAGGKKGDGTENVILDSKEKIEFYRSKMQELVLYKSRCDNRLNEITERAIADKREAESLGKKYEEKYKQVAEIASKLTIEEAKFRDIQGRKTELHQAIIKMEQGGSADGILQVRADRIQSDLEELLWAITERCKKHGLDVKSAALIELPIGWQPGVQEGAVDWDEDWDKFEDEGFVNDLTIDVKNVSLSPRSKLSSVQRENASSDHTYSPDSLSNAEGKPGDHLSTGERALEGEYSYTHSEDELARSPHGSPAQRTTLESQSPEYSDVHFEKSTEADAETHGSFDENWGVFDNNDDIDSVWGFNPVNTKDEKHRDFFGSDDFGVNSARTESPNEESTFQKKSPFTFEDSVPGTPVSRFGNSPPRYSESSRDQFDNFSRFDSFSMNNESPKAERFTRFDSISSAGDFGGGHSREFSYDFTDPFGSSGPFKVSSDSQAPKKDSANWNAF